MNIPIPHASKMTQIAQKEIDKQKELDRQYSEIVEETLSLRISIEAASIVKNIQSTSNRGKFSYEHSIPRFIPLVKNNGTLHVTDANFELLSSDIAKVFKKEGYKVEIMKSSSSILFQWS